MTPKNNTNQISSINIRIHPDLKTALDRYCEEHIEKISEAVTSAIKNFIGFGKPATPNKVLKIETVENKPHRLDIRVHPRLKKALQDFCTTNTESITDVVSAAIMTYIDFKE